MSLVWRGPWLGIALNRLQIWQDHIEYWRRRSRSIWCFVDEHILNLSVLVWFPAMWCRYLYQYQWNGCMCRVSCRLILSTCGTRQCYSQCSGLSSWLLLPWRWDLTLPWFQDDRELTHGGNLFEKDCERLPSLWIVIAKKNTVICCIFLF